VGGTSLRNRSATHRRSSAGATSEVPQSRMTFRKRSSNARLSPQSVHPSRWLATCLRSFDPSSWSRNAYSFSRQSSQSIPSLLVRPWPAGPKRGDPALSSQVVEPLLQELAAPVEPRHDRADRNAHHLGDLLIGEPLDVEQDGRPEFLGKGSEGLLHLARHDPVQKFLFGVSGIGPWGLLGHPPVQRELVHIVELGGLRLARALAIGVDKGVREDPEEPCLEVGSRCELLAKPQRADVCLLHEILCVR